VLALILCGIPRNLYDSLAFGYAPLPLANAIAFATVAERSRWWIRWPTLVLTAVGIAYGQRTPGHAEPYDAIIHDVVAHHVSLMAVQAEAVGALLPARPEQASRSADLIATTARQPMTELRRLPGVLRGPSDQRYFPERSELAPSASLTRVEEVLAQVRGSGVPVSSSPQTLARAPTRSGPGPCLARPGPKIRPQPDTR
jgi:hypothetical protein